jgi:hypothetical protein
MNSKITATPVEEEQDGSTIFGTLFDLQPLPERKSTRVPRSTLRNPQSSNKSAGPPHKECTVCLDTLSKSSFPESLHADQHNSDVCAKCFDEHIESELDDKSYQLIGCPQCPQTLTEPEIRQLARAVTYQKYDRPTFSWSSTIANQRGRYNEVASKAYIQEEEEFHACPNAACSWGTSRFDLSLFAWLLT